MSYDHRQPNPSFQAAPQIRNSNICRRQPNCKLHSGSAPQQCPAGSYRMDARINNLTNRGKDERTYWAHFTPGCFIAKQLRITQTKLKGVNGHSHISSLLLESTNALGSALSSVRDGVHFPRTIKKEWVGCISWTWLRNP